MTVGQEGPQPQPGRRIDVEEDGDLMIVNNGPLKVRLQRSRCTPLQRVSYDDKPIAGDDKAGIEFTVTDAAGNKYTSGGGGEQDVRFEIEEPGPLRLLVRWG